MIVDRAPLSGFHLGRGLHEAGQPGWTCHIVAETGSTNADLGQAARAGAAEGQVLVAESQTAGRGRLGRTWLAPPGAGLTLSVLLRPTVEPANWGWLPLLAGVALADTVRWAGLADAGLKWPNDLLVHSELGSGKCAGILAEVPQPSAVVIGIGLNVTSSADELPTGPTGLPATSLLLAGASILDRTQLAIELLVRLRQQYRQWLHAGGDAQTCGLRDAYLERCVTLGREVRVILASGDELVGTATTVDGSGHLVVETAGVPHQVAAGDVVHLR